MFVDEDRVLLYNGVAKRSRAVRLKLVMCVRGEMVYVLAFESIWWIIRVLIFSRSVICCIGFAVLTIVFVSLFCFFRMGVYYCPKSLYKGF